MHPFHHPGINKQLKRQNPNTIIQEIEAIEDRLLSVLSSNDAYLVRKYSNQQNRTPIRDVINRNPAHKELINEVYFAWTEFFENQKITS